MQAQFRNELINSYKNSENYKDVIEKLKKKYNAAADIFEKQKNSKI